LRGVDVVLLDAPCSGTGTLARRPDARWRVKEDDIQDLVTVQRQMLGAASDVVVPGGLLVYSTCSLEREENHEQIAAFLAGHREFTVEPTGAVPSEHVDRNGFLFVTPLETGSDGGFAARLRKAS
jgi:16S rRNA (cytosine967-C5)-methyltransferase